MEKEIRVLLVDDHAVVRSGLNRIFEKETAIRIVGEAADGHEAIRKAQELQPDVILLDLMMPVCSGLDALPAILEKSPRSCVVCLTVSEEEADLLQAIRLGARGYLSKSASPDEVLQAVKRVANGESILSPHLTQLLMEEMRQKKTKEEPLSPREREILQLVGEGLTNAEIAARLFIGETTVRTHLQRLLNKLKLKNRAEAIAYALRHNLVGKRNTSASRE
jgi:two-component system nitrate/nitrite response regulator NarL